MAIIVNTNLSALKTQNNLNYATTTLNKALERLSTGYKINGASDDAAGMFIANGLTTQISGSKIALSNVSTGTNVLNTVEGDLDTIMDHLYRIRDLATQAANSIYDKDSQDAMLAEVNARLEEIDRVAAASNFNGLNLLDGSLTSMRLQVGADADVDANSILVTGVFTNSDSTALGIKAGATAAFATATAAAQYIATIDTAIDTISTSKSQIGAVQNRLESAASSLTTTIENATAAKSTIMDADIAEESAGYTKARILQQTASTLLVQANALPSVALTLIAG